MLRHRHLLPGGHRQRVPELRRGLQLGRLGDRVHDLPNWPVRRAGGMHRLHRRDVRGRRRAERVLPVRGGNLPVRRGDHHQRELHHLCGRDLLDRVRGHSPDHLPVSAGGAVLLGCGHPGERQLSPVRRRHLPFGRGGQRVGGVQPVQRRNLPDWLGVHGR